MLALRLNPEIEGRLDRLAKKTGRTKSFYAREAIIERHWPHQGRMVFKLQGIDSINDADTLRGFEVVVPPEQRLPLEEGAVYIGDLIGCRVMDAAVEPQQDVGEILDVERGLGGAPDLLIVRPVIGIPEAPAAPVDAAAPPTGFRPRRGKRPKKLPELLIPFAKKYVVSIDTANKQVVMQLPPGLTELNAGGPDTEDAPAGGEE